MKDFPAFMKNPLNRVASSSQHSDDIEGFVFDGMDGSQVAFWTCKKGKESSEHIHDYDEYMFVVEGEYILIIDNERIRLTAGQEYHVPKGTAHASERTTATRTFHVFGGKRARRENEAR